VEPGIVLDVLNNEHLKPYKLRFGPEPATHMNCTLGGMIGNNSCGATAQRTGKVVDNIAALEVLLYDGTRFWCGPTSEAEYAETERRGDRQAGIYRQARVAAIEPGGGQVGRGRQPNGLGQAPARCEKQPQRPGNFQVLGAGGSGVLAATAGATLRSSVGARRPRGRPSRAPPGSRRSLRRRCRSSRGSRFSRRTR
jgi:FAD binding domain